MEIRYHIIMALFLIGCGICVRIGWLAATEYWDRRLTKELKAEAAEHFKQVFFDEFVVKFEERVEARAVEIATQLYEDYEKEKEKDNGKNYKTKNVRITRSFW